MEMDPKHKPQRISLKRRRIFEFIIEETQIKVGSSYFWIWWDVIDLVHKIILSIHLSTERNIFVAEILLYSLVNKYGKHSVSSDMVVVVGIHKHVNFCS
jgi:transposase-like protein